MILALRTDILGIIVLRVIYSIRWFMLTHPSWFSAVIGSLVGVSGLFIWDSPIGWVTQIIATFFASILACVYMDIESNDLVWYQNRRTTLRNLNRILFGDENNVK